MDKNDEQRLKERTAYLECRIAQLMTEADQIDQEILEAELEIDSISFKLSLKN